MKRGDAKYRWAARRLDTARRRVEQYAAEVEAIERDFADARAGLSLRFGVDVPDDPLVWDLLSYCEPREGDVWWWTGVVNNKGTPFTKGTWVEGGASYRTVARLLAIAFGVIDPDDNGLLQSLPGTQRDVNPWHKTFGRTERRMHGPGRFGGHRYAKAAS